MANPSRATLDSPRKPLLRRRRSRPPAALLPPPGLVRPTGGHRQSCRPAAWLAILVDDLPWQGFYRHFQPGADEDLHRLPRLRELTLVAALHHSRPAC